LDLAAKPRSRSAAPPSGCRRYGPGEHTIAPGLISPEALAVFRGLREAGYEAYLVGGCVRDLLLGHEPKDFDVSTNARPEQIRSLFRRSRIVGRRFQIVHVRSGREVIEVSTFRGHHGPDFDSDNDSDTDSDTETQGATSAAPPGSRTVCAQSGIVLRDNVFGSIEEDALRRDFTVNALYYDPDAGVVLDFSTGVADLRERLMRVIGDPRTRYQEDPVRMLRAIRFAAKLDFGIESEAEAAIAHCRHLLARVAPARMFDEVLKLLLTGQGEESFARLDHYDLFSLLFPDAASALIDEPEERSFLIHGLRNSDRRIAVNKTVTPAFLFAVLLWPAVTRRQHLIAQAEKLPASAALHEAIQDVVSAQMQHTTIPRRFATPMREIWELQHRLIARRQAQRVASHPRFRAAYDFILVREEAGEALDGAGDWWTRFQSGEAVSQPAPSRPRRRRRRSPRSARASAD